MVVLENEILYGQTFELSAEAASPDFVLPIGKAKVERQGNNVTLVAHSRYVGHALEAAKELEAAGIQAEV